MLVHCQILVLLLLLTGSLLPAGSPLPESTEQPPILQRQVSSQFRFRPPPLQRTSNWKSPIPPSLSQQAPTEPVTLHVTLLSSTLNHDDKKQESC